MICTDHLMDGWLGTCASYVDEPATLNNCPPSPPVAVLLVHSLAFLPSTLPVKLA